MTLTHLFDNLDAEAAYALGVPVDELQNVYNSSPQNQLHRISLIIEAALSTDPRHMFRAQRVYRLLRCMLQPQTFTCPCRS